MPNPSFAFRASKSTIEFHPNDRGVNIFENSSMHVVFLISYNFPFDPSKDIAGRAQTNGSYIVVQRLCNTQLVIPFRLSFQIS